MELQRRGDWVLESRYSRIETSPGKWCFRFIGDDGSNVFACIPISDQDYRKTSPTRAALVSHSASKGIHTFVIRCDWGGLYTLQVDGDAQPLELAHLQELVALLPKLGGKK